jgi:hypothetical protein
MITPNCLTARIVPALINGRRILIECPDWCTEDHVAVNERHLEDVQHCGAFTDLVVPGGEPSLRLLGHARLGLDSFAPRSKPQTVVAFDDGLEVFDLSPTEAIRFADDLEAFAAKVRELAAVASKAVA